MRGRKLGQDPQGLGRDPPEGLFVITTELQTLPGCRKELSPETEGILQCQQDPWISPYRKYRPGPIRVLDEPTPRQGLPSSGIVSPSHQISPRLTPT